MRRLLAGVAFVTLFALLPVSWAVNVTCVGDSITYGYGVVTQAYPIQLQALFDARDGAGAYTVGNYGINSKTLRNDGDRPYTADSIYPASLASNPDVVVILLGANDAKTGINWNVAAKDGSSTSIDIYNADFATLIESYRTLPSAPKIFVCTPVPVRTVGSGTDFGISGTVISSEMAPAIRTTVSAPSDVTLIEINASFPHNDVNYYISDKVHPSATGYAFMAEKIYDAVAAVTDPTWNIIPEDGATNVGSPLLSWPPNPAATAYDVYIGTNQTAVANATQASPEYEDTTPSTSYGPSLSDLTEYFWRIDAVTASTTITGSVWSFTTGVLPDPGITLSINFDRGGGEAFAGGQFIGPLASDSTHWNAASDATGTLSGLIDSLGVPTGATVQWQNGNTWGNNDGTADDQHRLSVGYLDDYVGPPSVTVSNIPYTAYRVYGLFATDQSPCGTVNFNVNGSWALGGIASSTASAWGTINANNASNGEYWTEIDPGIVQGNYWTVETSGTVCTIAGQPRSGSNRSCLTGLIIEELQDADGDGTPDTTDPDDDNDGMTDDWEIFHSLDPFVDDKAGNPDLDAYDNWAEYVTDTDPRDGNSKQTFSIELTPGTSDPRVRFNSSASRSYAVEYRDDLTSGTWLFNPEFSGTGSEMMVTNPAVGPRRYYRLRIELP